MSATNWWRGAGACLRLSRSYRRVLLNAWLPRWQTKARGIVLDVGGERSSEVAFDFAASGVQRWLHLNIDPAKKPDIVADGAHIPLFAGLVDCVICMETAEHVADPRQVISECGRILHPGGYLILTLPFVYRIHSQPWDFWRFTEYGARRLVAEAGLEVVELETQGQLLTVLCDMIKQAISEIRWAPLRWSLGLLFLPVATVLVGLEARGLGKNSRLLSGFTTGYAVLATKPGNQAADAKLE